MDPVAGARGTKTASLPAYSGGTVWDLHPLPLLIGKRRINTRVYPTRCDRLGTRPIPSRVMGIQIVE